MKRRGALSYSLRWITPWGHNSETILNLIPLTRVTWPTICHKGLKFKILYSSREMMRSLVLGLWSPTSSEGRVRFNRGFFTLLSQEQQGIHIFSISYSVLNWPYWYLRGYFLQIQNFILHIDWDLILITDYTLIELRIYWYRDL